MADARADLHVHSTASDGSDDPSAIGALAEAAGLGAVAITDHDTTSGWAPAAAGLPAGVTLVPGAELSCSIATSGRTIAMHLLAYLFDPVEPRLAARLQRMRDARLARVDVWERLLRADGHLLSLDALREQALTRVVGRPALVDALLAAGLVPDRETGFGPQWAGGRYRAPRLEWDVVDAITDVRGAGGVAVFAHPLARQRGPIVTLDDIARLAARGLGGIEVEHPDHTFSDRVALRALADEHELLGLGSSDYHGSGKAQELGAETTSPQMLEALVGAASGSEPVSRAAA